MTKDISSKSNPDWPNLVVTPALSVAARARWTKEFRGFVLKSGIFALLSFLGAGIVPPVIGVICDNSYDTAVAEAKSDAKIATVDVSKILNDSDEGKEQRAKLDALSAAAKKKLETKRAALKAMEEKLRASNATEDSPGAKDFRSQARDFSRLVKDSEDEVRQEFVKVNKKLTEKVLKIIKQYAEENEIDLILDKGVQERTLVLFGAPQADVTSQIVARMNK